MDQLQIPNYVKRILKLCMVLVLMSSFIIIIMGKSVSDINNETKVLGKFIDATKNVQPNFEKSLIFYTESSKSVMSYVSGLRPDISVEDEYIKFISILEDIGKNLLLNLNIKSVENVEKSKDTTNTSKFNISFSGAKQDLINFMKEIENLDYYIKINEVNFKSIDPATQPVGKVNKNIKLTLTLYVK